MSELHKHCGRRQRRGSFFSLRRHHDAHGVDVKEGRTYEFAKDMYVLDHLDCLLSAQAYEALGEFCRPPDDFPSVCRWRAGSSRSCCCLRWSTGWCRRCTCPEKSPRSAPHTLVSFAAYLLSTRCSAETPCCVAQAHTCLHPADSCWLVAVDAASALTSGHLQRRAASTALNCTTSAAQHRAVPPNNAAGWAGAGRRQAGGTAAGCGRSGGAIPGHCVRHGDVPLHPQFAARVRHDDR